MQNVYVVMGAIRGSTSVWAIKREKTNAEAYLEEQRRAFDLAGEEKPILWVEAWAVM